MLRSFCHYYTMIKEIDTFIEKVFQTSDISQKFRKPPLTYETYAAALQIELLNIKKNIVEFEVKLMKQGEILNV